MIYLRLKDYCKIKKLSNRAVSEKTNISEQTLSRIFTGITRLNESTMLSIFKNLNINPNDQYYIVTGTHFTNPQLPECPQCMIYKDLYEKLLSKILNQRLE